MNKKLTIIGCLSIMLGMFSLASAFPSLNLTASRLNITQGEAVTFSISSPSAVWGSFGLMNSSGRAIASQGVDGSSGASFTIYPTQSNDEFYATATGQNQSSVLNIYVYPTPILKLSNNTSIKVEGNEGFFMNASSTLGKPPYNYTWSFGANLTGSSCNYNCTIYATNNANVVTSSSISVYGTDKLGGQSQTITRNVEILPRLVISNISVFSTSILNQPAFINATIEGGSGNYTSQWYQTIFPYLNDSALTVNGTVYSAPVDGPAGAVSLNINNNAGELYYFLIAKDGVYQAVSPAILPTIVSQLPNISNTELANIYQYEGYYGSEQEVSNPPPSVLPGYNTSANATAVSSNQGMNATNNSVTQPNASSSDYPAIEPSTIIPASNSTSDNLTTTPIKMNITALTGLSQSNETNSSQASSNTLSPNKPLSGLNMGYSILAVLGCIAIIAVWYIFFNKKAK